MSAVMYRLQSSVGIVPALPDNSPDSSRWKPLSELADLARGLDYQRDFFRPLVKRHALLALEYNVLCTQLTHDFFREERNEKQNEQLTKQVATALMMAELLTYIYRDYLNVPREVARLRDEQKVYRDLLTPVGYQFSEDIPELDSKPEWLSQQIRMGTVSANQLRLVALRCKRVLNTLVPLAQQMSTYGAVMGDIDMVANPFFSYLSWLFFMPRFSVNMFLMGKHLIPGSWMSEQEKSLGFWRRLRAQTQRRWFELGNDSLWIVAGVLGCFLLIGGLAPIGMYLNVAYYLYDVVLALIRFYLETSRLEGLRAQYQAMIAAEQAKEYPDEEKIKELEAFEQHLQARYKFEQKRLMIGVVNTTALLLALVLCLPIMFTIHPVIPLIGAILIIAITVATYYAAQELEKQRPQGKIASLPNAPALSRFGVFKSQPKATSVELRTHLDSSDEDVFCPP